MSGFMKWTENITPWNPFGFTKSNVLAPFGNKGSPADLMKAKPVSTPAVPAVFAPSSPAQAEVIQAGDDIRKAALRKKGMDKMTFAGETGGFSPTVGLMGSGFGQKLGGG
jgi:hypothetical protein